MVAFDTSRAVRFGALAGIVLLAACSEPKAAVKPASPIASVAASKQLAAAPSTPAARAAAELGIAVLPSAGELAGATVDVIRMRFEPQDIRIRAGQTVTWTVNDGDVPHTVTAFDQSFDSGVLRAGSFTLRFDTPGAYCYQCAVHPGINLCNRGATSPGGALPLLPVGDAPSRQQVAPPALGGGGHMQGRVIVE
jgi:plastocyanin